ncbi:MAG: ATP-binding protein [Candidatus Aegiribacteria sp.]|nr:ATP-binding protein [Candidatus Aegiribacteria sp.]
MIKRPDLFKSLNRCITENPVTTLLGPRQCGKTTIARTICEPAPVHYYDLENPADRSGLANPLTALGNMDGLVILDEIHRMPELYEILRVLVDDTSHHASYLILGSASPGIVRDVSETLAGRIGFVDMGGFNLKEISPDNWEKRWLRGGFPRSYLAADEDSSFRWRDNFARTFLERDLRQFGFSIHPESMRRFWIMVAHYHGQIWNAAEFARSLGRDEKTARNYLDILSGTLVVRQLQPWHVNIKKRQVKSPKVYIRDSGILHSLLSIRTRRDLLSHIKAGASWEGFALEQILSITGDRDAYFWSTHGGAEFDLLLSPEGARLGFEFKFTDNVHTTKSMRIAIEDLELKHLYIIHPGVRSYQIDANISALSISNLISNLSDIMKFTEN